jgi:hypothetical protein
MVILIVEDEFLIGWALKLVLHLAGHHAVVVSNAKCDSVGFVVACTTGSPSCREPISSSISTSAVRFSAW